jgi:hypothetical protein
VTVRVYLPATLDLLGEYVAAGGVGPAPVPGHAVTAALREEWPDGTEEEWEYAALAAAADAAADLLEEPGRRVVLAADVPTAHETDGTEVEVPDAFGMRLVAAVHADPEDVDPRAGDLPDLGWYATQEIPDLLG